MASAQVAHLAGESSLARCCRRACPLPTTTRHSQRAAHTPGHPSPPGAYVAPRSSAVWRPAPMMVVAAAAGARPPSTPSRSPTGGAQPQQQQPPAHGLVGTLPYSEGEYVEVGRVVGAHGVRGELRLELSTDEPDKRFKAGRRLYLLPPSSQGPAPRPGSPEALPLIPVTCRGSKSRPLGKGEEAWMVALGEVENRTQAESLRGHLVLVAAAERDALRDPDEFYVTDIIGCAVIDQASRRMVGQVVDVYSGMGTHDTLRVKLRANEEDIRTSRIRYVLIPFVRAICPVLDRAGRMLEVVPPEGLMDLATHEQMKKPLSDAAKAQKLAQLREVLAREAAERAKQPAGPQEQQREAAEAEREGEEDDGEEEVVEKEGDGAQQEGGAGGVRLRRPGLRRRSGSLRLGRRRE